MTELAYIFQVLKKMWFVILGVSLATCLVVVATNLAMNEYTTPAAWGSDIRDNFTHLQRSVGDGLRAITRLPSDILRSTVHAMNVKNLITPAAAMSVPTITPIASSAPQTTTPPATPIQPVPVTPVRPHVITNAPPATIVAASPSLATTNTYAWGNCTWYAAIRRSEVNDPIPNSWGNAATWAARAARDGYAVDHHPSPGAIMQTAASAGGLGHVAFVDSVDPDGTWHISEMNVLGLDVVDHKALPSGAAASYNFIHDRV